MTNMKLFLVMFWIYFISPLISIGINAVICLKNVMRVREIKSEKQTITSLPLPSLLNSFSWHPLNLTFYQPSIFTILTHQNQENTYGSAFLAKFWYKKHKIKSKIIYLFNHDLSMSHTICITKDHSEFISNNKIIQIKPNQYWLKYTYNEYYINYLYYYFEGNFTIFF